MPTHYDENTVFAPQMPMGGFGTGQTTTTAPQMPIGTFPQSTGDKTTPGGIPVDTKPYDYGQSGQKSQVTTSTGLIGGMLGEPSPYTSENLYRLSRQDSPEVIAAQTQARRQAGASGLLNTAGAQSNVYSNVRRAMLPVAAQDAATARAFETQRIQNQQTLDMLERDWGYKFDMAADTQDFQRDLAQMGFDQQDSQQIGQIYGSLVNTMLSNMGRVMATPDATWSQTMQNDFEDAINASKQWLASLYNIPLN